VIKVLIVDDNPIIRQGARSLLEAGGGGLEVVGEGATGKEAIQLADELDADIVLLDIRMPVMNGIEAAKAITPKRKVLMLTYSEDEPVVHEAIRAGASGYLVHGRFEADELERAVHTVMEGGTVLSPAVAPIVFDLLRRDVAAPSAAPETGPASLTERERGVMNLIARGRTNRQIADELVISEKTVKNHIRHIYEKLDVTHRAQAIAQWLGVEQQREEAG
jgi:DNA-binding NarL/FixJ family response regulator